MNLHEEITRTAYELYERSGCIGGLDFENWLEAERIVLTRHAGQVIEEPEGEELMIAADEISDEVEERAPAYAVREMEDATVDEEMEVRGPALGTKEDMAVKAEKIRPARTAAAKGKKTTAKKTFQKSREKFH
ncbi:MAG: DUF2934 domain-containing protein [Nitrospirae bacterium]|nr:DUF2934 domain-containing protein [Nitrospirota bacterium]